MFTQNGRSYGYFHSLPTVPYNISWLGPKENDEKDITSTNLRGRNSRHSEQSQFSISLILSFLRERLRLVRRLHVCHDCLKRHQR